MSVRPDLVGNRYQLREPLGVGGMGRVWRAWDESLHRDVAIKLIQLPPELIEHNRDVATERALREARAAARLNHPNVVRVYDVLKSDDQPWLVMEYVASRSLHEVVTQDGPIEPRRAAQIGLDVLSALRAAHRAGVQHRDIKPSNVLLTPDGRVVLTDFGIATIEGDTYTTRTGLVLGSPEYIAPERAKSGISGSPADLWSLGAALYFAVEGRSPFQRNSAIETLSALATEEPDPVRRAGPLKPVLRALLRKDPDARANFVEVERLLQTAAVAPSARVLPAPLPKQRRWWRRGSGGSPAPASPSLPPAPSSPSLPPASPVAPGGPIGRAASAPVPVRGSAAPIAPPAAQPAPPNEVPTGRAAVALATVYGTAPPPVESVSPPASPDTAVPETTGTAGVSPPEAPPAAEPAIEDAEPPRAETLVDAPVVPAADEPAGPQPVDDDAPVDESSSDAAAVESPAAPAAESSADAAVVESAAAPAPEAVDAPVDESSSDAAAEQAVHAPVDESSSDAAAEEAVHAPVEESSSDAAAVESAAAPAAEAVHEPVGAATSVATPAVAATAPAAPTRPSTTSGAGIPTRPTGERATKPNRRGLVVGAIAAVVAIAVILTIVLVTNRSNGTNQGGAGTPAKPTTQPAATTTAAQATTEAPSPITSTAAPNAAPTAQGKTLPALPAGWVDYHDPTGFSVYVPANWRRSKTGSIMYFRGDGRVLGVDQTNKPHMDPVADWRSQSSYRVSRGDFPNYHEIKIAHVDYFITAADWEFTFDRNGRQHVNNRGVVVSNHQAYGFYWQTADSQWDAARPDLQLVFDSFRPAQ